jgi:ribosomal protein L32
MALRNLSAAPWRQSSLLARRSLAQPAVAAVHPALRVAQHRAFGIAITSSASPAVSAISGLSSLLQDIWESVLRAVPKKKTSHSKTRSRQLAGKGLKDVTALTKCSSCGRTKRANVLCPYCVQGKSDLCWRGATC